jgi:hypothetical protein
VSPAKRALTEQRIEIGRVVLQAAGFVAHRKTHGRRLRFDTQLVEEAGQQRVMPRVVDDKTAIHGVASAVQFDLVRVGMAAEVIVGLEQYDLMHRRRARQQPSRSEPCDARTDDRDAH